MLVKNHLVLFVAFLAQTIIVLILQLMRRQVLLLMHQSVLVRVVVVIDDLINEGLRIAFVHRISQVIELTILHALKLALQLLLDLHFVAVV